MMEASETDLPLEPGCRVECLFEVGTIWIWHDVLLLARGRCGMTVPNIGIGAASSVSISPVPGCMRLWLTRGEIGSRNRPTLAYMLTRI